MPTMLAVPSGQLKASWGDSYLLAVWGLCQQSWLSGRGGQAVSVKLELCCSVQYKGSLKQGIRSQNGHVMQSCHVCASAGVCPWQPLWAGSLSYAGGTASVTQASWMRTGTTLLARVSVWSKVSNMSSLLSAADGGS
jgi:hypothetical protein